MKKIPKQSSSFKRKTKKYFSTLQSSYKKKVEEDFKVVTDLLEQGKPIPDRYKNHPVAEDSEGTYWELHLVSYNSDCLLVYKLYDEYIDNKLVKIIKYCAITDHEGMNKIIHSFVQDNLLLDEDEVQLVLGE